MTKSQLKSLISLLFFCLEAHFLKLLNGRKLRIFEPGIGEKIRILKEYFEPPIGENLRISSLGRFETTKCVAISTDRLPK